MIDHQEDLVTTWGANNDLDAVTREDDSAFVLVIDVAADVGDEVSTFGHHGDVDASTVVAVDEHHH